MVLMGRVEGHSVQDRVVREARGLLVRVRGCNLLVIGEKMVRILTLITPINTHHCSPSRHILLRDRIESYALHFGFLACCLQIGKTRHVRRTVVLNIWYQAIHSHTPEVSHRTTHPPVMSISIRPFDPCQQHSPYSSWTYIAYMH
jgi:hypothetical protein